MKRNNRTAKLKNKFNPEKFIDTMLNNVVCVYSGLKEQNAIDRSHKKLAMGVFRQRRKEALMRLLPLVKKECLPTTDKELEDYLIALFLSNEFLPGFDYNAFDSFRDFRLGAIIWILDQLKRAGNLDKALERLPYFGNREDYPILPKNFFHPCYSKAVLESMMFVITMRFRSSQEKELDECLATDNIVLKENAEGREYSVAFQEIVELLPKDAVEKACVEFRNMVLEAVRIFLKGQYYLKEKYKNGVDYLNNAGKTIRKVFDYKSSRLVGPVASLNSNFSLKDFGFLDSSGNSDAPIAFAGKDNVFSNPQFDEYTNFNNYLERLKEASDKYCQNYNKFFSYDRQQLHDIFDNKDMEDMFLSYSVKDPLAMCFALIYLIDHGDDIPWLFRSGGCVMDAVFFSLPWGPGRKEEAEEGSRIHSIRFRSFEFTPEGWLGRDSNMTDCYSGKGGNMNLSQLFYRMTGCVIPAGISNPFEGNNELSELGLSDYENGFVNGAAYSAFLSSQQARLPEETDDGIGSENNDTGNGDEEAGEDARREAAIADLNSKLSEASKSREDLQTELLRARREVKCLKRALAEDKKKYAAEIVQKDEELKKARLEHRELIDLREKMFSGFENNNFSAPLQENQDIGLPYETRKRVVIFGGHATYLKQLKGFLPNARFVDVDNIAFNPDIVRNADVVWIQNNCISHSQFWNVVKEARQYSVQVRYFAYSSAEKSALQVVEDDMSSAL